MKQIIAWIFCLLMAAFAGLFWNWNQKAGAEILHWEQKLESLNEASTKPEEAGGSGPKADERQAEIERLTQELRDLPRVRSEYHQIKQRNLEVSRQLEREMKVLAQEAYILEAEKKAIAQRNAVLSPQTVAVSQANACIANLKQLESAKEQFALEARLAAEHLPRDEDLFGFDRYIRTKPVCPAGGVYTINIIRQNPTCSIPGHQLPVGPQ